MVKFSFKRGGKQPAKKVSRRSGPTLGQPEGIAMLAIAVFADFITPIITLGFDFLFGIGEVIDYVFDIFFTAILGTWMYLRGARRNRASRFLKRRLPLIVIEYIPLLSSFSPTWVIATIIFLREGEKHEEG